MKLKVNNLRCEINGQTLLKHIDVDFSAGQLHVLLGANGAGKSSLLRALSGELPPSGGSIYLDGSRLDEYHIEDKARRLAVLPQRSQLDFPFRTEEVVAMGRYACLENQSQTEALVAEVISVLGLQPLQGRPYTRLSGGEQQRVQIARVLVQLWHDQSNGVFLLDEPNAPLDLYHQLALFEQLQAMARHGATIVVSTHDINLAASYADQVILLDKGEVLAAGSAETVLSESLIEAAYGVRVAVRRSDSAGLRVDYPIR